MGLRVWTGSSWHRESGFCEKGSEHLGLIKSLRVVGRDVTK